MSNMFYTLSASLAQATGKDEILCRGVLRVATSSSVPYLREITNPVETMDYINKMTYSDWKAIIEGPVLSNVLVRAGMRDSAIYIARLMQTLVEQQSLFTMAAH